MVSLSFSYTYMEEKKKEIFRVIIAGSREWTDYELLKKKCSFFLQNKLADPGVQVVILSGHAKGADLLGEKFAQENNLPVELYPAQWDKYGKRAGYLRNKDMADKGNAAIIFLSRSAQNKGSLMMASLARKQNLLLRTVWSDEESVLCDK